MIRYNKDFYIQNYQRIGSGKTIDELFVFGDKTNMFMKRLKTTEQLKNEGSWKVCFYG